MNINTISRIVGKLLLIMVLLLHHLPFQLTHADDQSSSSDNHEVTAISEHLEKTEESEELENSKDGSNRTTEYRLELVASPLAGGNPRRTDSSGSNVVWLQVGQSMGNMHAFPNPGYRFLRWEVVSGPIFIFSPNIPDLAVSQSEAGNSVIRAVYESVPGGNITVKHEDEEGNQLANPSVLTGLVDQTYTTEALSISGWQLSKTPENASGTFRVEEQTVVYTYEPEQNLWGTVPWSYEEGTETITLYGGEAGEVADAPWKVYSSVKEIIVEETVVLPEISTRLFSGLTNLEVIENAGNLDVSNVTMMEQMFSYASSLKSVDVSRWDTSQVTSMGWMFNQTYSLQALDVSQWDTSQVTSMRTMFQNSHELKELDVSNWNTSKVTNMSFMFNQTYSLQSLDVSQWDTSQVTSMRTMFQNSRELKELDVGNWDTSKVTDMDWMFSQTHSLHNLDVSQWDTSQVTSMNGVFQNSRELKELDVSNWNTSKVTSMSWMFNQTHSLQVLDVSQWDTSQVTSMRTMFQNSRELKELDVSNWDTSKVTDMGWMFNQTHSLQALDVSQWNTSRVTKMNHMFFGTNNLKRISLGEKSIFDSSVNLPNRQQDNLYTSRWVLEESLTSGSGVIAFENSTDFMTNYDGSNPGTYIWEPVPPEQLIAKFDPVSDQSVAIHGHATESVDHLTITYKNTEGSTVVLEKDSPRIVWGEYQDTQEKVRSFQINLTENERLETGSTVEIKLSKPSGDTTGDVAEEQTVIKGIDYRSNNFTLDRSKLNELATVEALHALILQESRAQAKNILSEEDMTNDFRIVETDLSLDSEEDGSYYAILEVGDKAYQMTIGIDLTSKVEHLRVTIPVKMIFESLYDEKESNRQFESQTYEIHNQSSVAIDTYINQVAIDDSAGIVLLKKGEDPLDYAESAVEDPSYEDITKPLLRLHLQTQETKKQLYATMPEQHLIRLSEGDRTPLSLSGEFYGNYPRWIDHPELEQGGYYESTLVPNYRIVLRFVPRI
ncbi:BspA family leucine-rich repeat surface protein [Enterococcus mundtii]|uniref:Bacterial surface protein 26-residue n=1 Tax=Enterococcus mundtii TaxID=53346 RepID=A0AAI8WEB4_ENTMU|nr:BspA family leucine-rich repeat surface protein [Enterococcus mundtii]BBM15368.1 bacterial surface protein 26-residue [Enterococcus mundtii]